MKCQICSTTVRIVGWHRLIQRLPTMSHHCVDFCSLYLSLSCQCVAVSSLFWFLSFPVALLAKSVISRIAWLTVILIDLIGEKHCRGKQSAPPLKFCLSSHYFRQNMTSLLFPGESLFFFLSTCGPYSTVGCVQTHLYSGGHSVRKFWFLLSAALLIMALFRAPLIVSNIQRVKQSIITVWSSTFVQLG